MDSLPTELLVVIGRSVIRITDLRSLSRTTSQFRTICKDLITKLESAYQTKYKKFSFCHHYLNSPLEKYTIELVLDGYQKSIPDRYYILENTIICSMLAFCGDFDLLKEAHAKGCQITNYTPACASYNGHLNILQWIVDNTSVRNDNDIAHNATIRPHFKILEWLIESERDFNSYQNVFLAGMESGHISVIEWYLKQKNAIPVSDEVFYTSSSYGHIHLLEWGIKKWGKPTEFFYDGAVEFGFPNVLQWALDNNYLAETPHWELALTNEQTNVLQWALDHNYDIEEIYVKAVQEEKIKILQWAHDSNQKIYDSFLYDAVTTGRIKVLKWAKLNNYDFSPDLGLCIIERNRIETMLYLLSYGVCSIEFLREGYIFPRSQHHFVIINNQLQMVEYQNEENCPKIIYVESSGNILVDNFTCGHNCWCYFYMYHKNLYPQKFEYMKRKLDECSIHKKYNIL